MENHLLVAEVRWRRLALCLVHVSSCLASCYGRGKKHLPESRKQSAHVHRNSLFVEPINGHQWMCVTRNAGDVAPDHRESGKDRQWCFSRRGEGQRLSRVRPRAVRVQNRFRTDPALLRWDLAGKPCTRIKMCRVKAVNFKEKNTNPTGDRGLETAGQSANTLSGPDSGSQNILINGWTAQMQVWMNNQEMAQEKFAPVAALSSILPAFFSIGSSSQHHPTWSRGRCFQLSGEDGESVGCQSSMDTRMDQNGVQSPSLMLEQMFLHESNRCVEAQPNVPLLTLPKSTTPPSEQPQEVKIPKFATVIRERGGWPRHSLLAVFWAPAGAKDRSHEFRASNRDTLLRGIAAQIKLDSGEPPFTLWTIQT